MIYISTNDIIINEREISTGLRAFVLSMERLIAEDPEYMLDLAEFYSSRGLKDTWKEMYEQMQRPECMANLKKSINQQEKDIEWSLLEKAAEKWAEFGWVIGCGPFNIDLWEIVPQTQKEADAEAMKYINNSVIEKIWEKTFPILPMHNNLFQESCSCFKNRCYAACASLLISLIDGTLISSKANGKQINRKTGGVAQKRVSDDILQQDFYRLPGFFHWDFINVDTFIMNLFGRANNFTNEPKGINRNFLHHGMTKRKVLRKDCIKLFIAYKHVLSYCE